MAGSHRVVAHSVIAIVMGGSIAGLLPSAAAAEPHCARASGPARRVHEVSRYCPAPMGSVRQGIVPDLLGLLERGRRHRNGPTGNEPWLGWRKRYPPTGHETRHHWHPVRHRGTEAVRPGGRVDDKPGMLPGRPAGVPDGAGKKSRRRAEPAETRERTPRRPASGAPDGSRGAPVAADPAPRAGGAPAPRGGGAPAPRAADRPAAHEAPATGHRTPPVPPRRTAPSGRAAEPGHAVASGTRPGSGHRSPGRRAADPVPTRDPSDSQAADAGTRTPDASAESSAKPEPRIWTIRHIGGADDGLAALRFGVTLVLGLVIAAGTLLLIRITRVMPIAPGDTRRGGHHLSALLRLGARPARRPRRGRGILAASDALAPAKDEAAGGGSATTTGAGTGRGHDHSNRPGKGTGTRRRRGLGMRLGVGRRTGAADVSGDKDTGAGLGRRLGLGRGTGAPEGAGDGKRTDGGFGRGLRAGQSGVERGTGTPEETGDGKRSSGGLGRGFGAGRSGVGQGADTPEEAGDARRSGGGLGWRLRVRRSHVGRGAGSAGEAGDGKRSGGGLGWRLRARRLGGGSGAAEGAGDEKRSGVAETDAVDGVSGGAGTECGRGGDSGGNAAFGVDVVGDRVGGAAGPREAVTGGDGVGAARRTFGYSGTALGTAGDQVRASFTVVPRVPPASARLMVRLLGGVVVEGPGGRIDCAKGKDLPDLLGLLAVHRDGLTREKAHELLWPDVDLSDYDRFHSRKKEIRRRLLRAHGDAVRETMLIKQVSQRYYLNADLIDVDLWRLTEALSAAATADGLRERLAVLRTAVDLYAGPFLPGSTRPWSVPVAEDLRRNVVRAITTLIEHEHDASRLIALLDRALALDPCNEPLRRRQMRLHADLGRVDEAHRSYRDLVAALDELGGLRPSPLTSALYRQLIGPAE
jgi:DNA-binding SARP family transcriptional activator